MLLDLVMKGMYGLDVLRKLREMDPDARVIVVSADVQTSSHELVQAGGAAGFINKPAAPGQVVEDRRAGPRAGARRGADRHPVRRARRAAEHRVRPRRGVALGADRPPRAARGAAGRRSTRSPSSTRRSATVLSDDVASVHQIFSGPVGGDALLILDHVAAGSLKELLTERAGAAAADRRVGARGAHRGRQHPAQRLPGHLRQPSARCRSRSRCRS